jgi:hypothetical protein
MRPRTGGRLIENERRALLSQDSVAQAGHFKLCRYGLTNVQKFSTPKQFRKEVTQVTVVHHSGQNAVTGAD